MSKCSIDLIDVIEALEPDRMHGLDTDCLYRVLGMEGEEEFFTLQVMENGKLSIYRVVDL